MDTRTAQRIVLASMAAVVLTAEIRRIGDGTGPTILPPVGGLIAAAGLSTVASSAPDVAAKLALIVLVAQLATNGPTAMTVLAGVPANIAKPRNYTASTAAPSGAVDSFRTAASSATSGQPWWAPGLTGLGIGFGGSTPAGVSSQSDSGDGTVTWKTPAGTTVRTSPRFQARLGPLMATAQAAGIRLTGGAYRSHAEQVALYNAHCHGGVCNPPTAKPGTSRHETGDAIDFDNCQAGSPVFNWLKANAGQFQVYNFAKESWHWSIDGN
jgi:hypothetical protein